MKVSAYIPCFNNSQTIAEAIRGIQAQSFPAAELFVVDDASIDGSVELAQSLSVKVVRHQQNLGRGAVRARAIQEARHDLVLCCDATNVLDRDFLKLALRWFDDPRIAAVYGRLAQLPAQTLAARWRGRHLYRLDQPPQVRRGALLATGGALARTSTVRAVGNFDRRLRHSEDRELGQRLLDAGYDVIYDPNLAIVSIAKNTLGQVLERHWRWNAGQDEAIGCSGYLRQIAYSIKVMARQDLRARDPWSAAISLLSPHYQFWRAFRNKVRRSDKND